MHALYLNYDFIYSRAFNTMYTKHHVHVLLFKYIHTLKKHVSSCLNDCVVLKLKDNMANV